MTGKNKVLYSISNTMRTFEVLLISVFLSRFILNKNDLGQILQIIFISVIMVTLVSGLPLSLNFFYGKYANSSLKGTLFVKFFFAILILTFSFCLFIYVFKDIISYSFQNEIIKTDILVVLTFIFIKAVNTIFPNYHYLKNKLDKYLLLYVMTICILIFFLIYDLKQNLLVGDIILKQLIIVEFLRLFINALIINKQDLEFKKVLFNRDELRYVLIISVGIFFGAIGLHIDKYLVATLLNPTQFVFYQNGAINLPFVHIITSSLFIASIPIFSQLYNENKITVLIQEIKSAILKCSVFLIPILVYCFFEAIPLISFIYGEGFNESGEVFKIYILRYALSVMAYSVFMGSIGLEKKANFIIFLTAALGLILNLVLIPLYGVKGASWATVFASLSTIFISFHFISNKLNTSFLNYFPLKNYIKIILYSVLIYLPFYFLNSYFNFKLIVIISAIIYYFIVLLVSNQDLKLIKLTKSFNKNH